MRCPKCKKKISSVGISFCPHCGSYIRDENKNKENSNLFFYLIILLFWILTLYAISNYTKADYYFESPEVTKEKNEDKKQEQTKDKTEEHENEQTEQKDKDESIDDKSNVSSNNKENKKEEIVEKAIYTKGVTSIVYNHKYSRQFSINNLNDVLFYIRKDSIDQKNNCPLDIKTIEENIINNYGITAVNLCEMDISFAREILNVTRYIYYNYPTTHGHITNLTLANLDEDTTYMAAYMPIFTFITNNSITGYPLGIKSQVILNAKYFLDLEKIESSVKYGSSSGYFPSNATRSSTVAHEFGHYISFVAMLNYYHVDQLTFISSNNSEMLYHIYDDFNRGDFSYKIIESAFLEYKLSYGNSITFDNFRSSISSYAVAKDKDGNYIYDETIAEAFHDVYLNGTNAKIASKLIMNKLKNYL